VNGPSWRQSRRLLALILVLLGYASATAAGPGGRAASTPPPADDAGRLGGFLSRLQVFQHDLKDLSGAFHQLRETKLLGSSVASSGQFWYRHPDQLRLKYTSPETSEVVVKGADVWLYFPASQEAQHYTLENRAALSGLFVGFGGEAPDLRENFEVSLLEDARRGPNGEGGLVLAPREGSSLAVDVSRVEIVLSAVRINPGLAPTLFDFTPPPGVTVVDHAGR